MASVVNAPVQLKLNSNVTTNVATTFLTGQSAGIRVTSVKFENNTSTAVYMTPNGSGRKFYIDIKGTTSGSYRLLDTTIKSDWGGLKNIGSNGTVTCSAALKGDIQLVVSISSGYGATTGFIGDCKITMTYEVHPTVSAGDPITKTQMDALRTYLGAGTAVTQNATITAAVGNTYKSGLTAGTTVIDDAWYNGV